MKTNKTYIPFSWLFEDIKEIVGGNKANMIYEKISLKYPASVIYISAQEADKIAYKSAYLALKRQKKSKSDIVRIFMTTFNIKERTAYNIIKRLEDEKQI